MINWLQSNICKRAHAKQGFMKENTIDSQIVLKNVIIHKLDIASKEAIYTKLDLFKVYDKFSWGSLRKACSYLGSIRGGLSLSLSVCSQLVFLNEGVRDVWRAYTTCCLFVHT